MSQRSKGSRLKLGEPLASDLLDFRAASYWAPEIEVVREAVRRHIDTRLNAEPEMKRRFEQARRTRLGLKHDNIRVIQPARE
jgi:hypothetical protein